MISKEVYLNPILNNVPRLLGLLNRNITSSCYGCFDREYWHYNTVDFACARKQEGVLTLSLLYLIDHGNNQYYKSSEMLEYVRAALLFWAKIQNPNGSFNEWYPSEHSFVVTSFSTYAVSESLLLLKDELSSDVRKEVLQALEKAGKWLLSRHEPRVMNQQTGAALALLNLHLLTGDSTYMNASREKIARLHQKQSKEGWFLEYGGPDIGYLSLAIDYLCKYYRKTEDATVKDILDSAMSFIKYFIHPNLIAGGEYTSRNTEYLIPHGFELLSQTSEDACFAASVVRKAITTPDSFPHLLDDRYLTYNGYTWLQAYIDANDNLDDAVDQTIERFFGSSFRKYFEEAGLLIVNDDHKHFVVNVKKGGAFRLFDKKVAATHSDSGILIRSEGKWFTSGWLSKEVGTISGNVIAVSGNLWKVPDKVMTTAIFVLLRLFQSTLGRFSTISLWMKERLRDILITKTKPSGIRFERTMTINGEDDGLLLINDRIMAGSSLITDISVSNRDTPIYVPSSRYYTVMKNPSFKKKFFPPVQNTGIDWKIGGDSEIEFNVK